MWVHNSGERLAIRLRDLDSPIRKEFTTLAWFPVDPDYRVTAKFVPHPEPKPVEILNMLGDIERYESALMGGIAAAAVLFLATRHLLHAWRARSTSAPPP